uniref:Uncharacterized protein n=1 Tax=Vitis vinifera TaxID=29760 RepID=F6HBB2_VITVI
MKGHSITFFFPESKGLKSVGEARQRIAFLFLNLVVEPAPDPVFELHWGSM